MRKNLPKMSGDWITSPQSVVLMAMFADHGYTGRFVGGVVRNALLGEPINDLDVATDALPQVVMELAQKAGFKAIATGLDHGTVTLVIEAQVYEITTLRVDVETHGRHAKVAFTDDWVEDARRRDFTMNALYVDADGTLYDPIDGYDDLMARRVRFIGDPEDRITEDYLRILRFFRFSAQYGAGQLDAVGLAACVRLQKGLNSLSRERIKSEFMRLILMPQATPVLDIMFAHGLLLPLIHRVPHLERLKKWRRFEAVLGREKIPIDRLGALSILVREDVDVLAKRLRLSNLEKHALSRWTLNAAIARETTEQQARILCYRLGNDYRVTVAINWLLSGKSEDDQGWRKRYDLQARWHCPNFPVKGQHLVANGMAPGPAIGKKMRELEGQWIDSDFTLTKKELLNHLNNEQQTRIPKS